MKYIPNIITVLRILLTPLLAYVILSGDYMFALACAVLMGFSDGADGFLAKRFNWCSRLGEQLDPLADKLMLVSAFIALWWVNLLPLWFVVTLVVRDVFLVAGAIIGRITQGRQPLRPIMLSKVSTFAQIMLLFCLLLGQFAPMFQILVPSLTLLSVITAVVSAFLYTQSFLFAQPPIKHYRSRISSNPTKTEMLK